MQSKDLIRLPIYSVFSSAFSAPLRPLRRKRLPLNSMSSTHDPAN
jgi:hypothetical protein